MTNIRYCQYLIFVILSPPVHFLAKFFSTVTGMAATALELVISLLGRGLEEGIMEIKFSQVWLKLKSKQSNRTLEFNSINILWKAGLVNSNETESKSGK